MCFISFVIHECIYKRMSYLSISVNVKISVSERNKGSGCPFLPEGSNVICLSFSIKISNAFYEYHLTFFFAKNIL